MPLLVIHAKRVDRSFAAQLQPVLVSRQTVGAGRTGRQVYIATGTTTLRDKLVPLGRLPIRGVPFFYNREWFCILAHSATSAKLRRRRARAARQCTYT